MASSPAIRKREAYHTHPTPSKTPQKSALFSSARRDVKFCYMGVISTEKLLCVLITSLTLSLVYIIGSSGRIRSTTGTWAEPLFSNAKLNT
jgi:hypothetical protein